MRKKIIKKNNYRVFGINSSIPLLKNKKFKIIQIIIEKNSPADKNEELKNLITKRDYNCKYLSKIKFQVYNNHRSQGIIIDFDGDVVLNNLPDYSNKNSICLLALDSITDPQNIGQIIRTSECAGINGILFPKNASAPVNDTVLQVSQGAFISMPLFEITNLRNTISVLKDQGFWVIGVENSINATDWDEIDYTEKKLIVVGSEGSGIRKKVLESCDFFSTIPMQGNINSLNVSAATSAILFERLRQIKGVK
tara:strand:+ start:45 stop:800 length:756 start_codon:yes stop_codon:yes gene_type:complete